MNDISLPEFSSGRNNHILEVNSEGLYPNQCPRVPRQLHKWHVSPHLPFVGPHCQS